MVCLDLRFFSWQCEANWGKWVCICFFLVSFRSIDVDVDDDELFMWDV